MMRVVVCGSRNWNNDERIKQFIDKLPDGALVTTGGAPGADALAHKFATERGLATEVYKANWEKHGRSAGLKRNLFMLSLDPNLVVAFWDGKSRGTEHMINATKQAGILLRIIRG